MRDTASNKVENSQRMIAARSALWDYQQAAVDSVECFLSRGTNGSSFVVAMPTGTGKSGVIAYLAQTTVSRGDVLLLCPWDALVRQLGDDVHSRFWRHANVDDAEMNKPVRLYPRNAKDRLEKAEGHTIWVMTIAALRQMPAEVRIALAARLALVVVDEGHYEPAPAWAETIRSLECPTLIFSATPFRNDFKYFSVDSGDYFHYPLRQAITSRVLRTPRFREIAFDSIDSFVDELLRLDSELLTSHDRLIVRCESAEEIAAIVRALKLAGRTAIGLHEKFDDSADGSLRRTVPADDPARYWVHQYKLIEGIDNARFRCVAFYSKLRNDRAVVQQIGRVLRGAREEPEAWVISKDSADLERVWAAFQEFDASNDASQNTVRNVLTSVTELYQYVSGAFRTPFDFNVLDWTELRVLKSARAYSIPPRDADNLEEALTGYISRAVTEADAYAPAKSHVLAGDTAVLPGVTCVFRLYALAQQSPLLSKSSFLNFSLGVTVLVSIEDRLYVQSDLNLGLEDMGYRPVGHADLRGAFDGGGNQFTQITLTNTDLSSTAERSRTQSAVSLAQLSPDLGDYFKSPSTITGVAESNQPDGTVAQLSRYVGFSKARIREHGRVNLGTYVAWIRRVNDALRAGKAEPALLSRYAELVECRNPEVINLLLALETDDFRGPGDEPLAIEDVCIPVIDGRFVLSVEGSPSPVDGEVMWDGDRFVVHCESIDDRFVDPGAPSASFSARVTNEQSFRLIVQDRADPGSTIFYANGQFVRPRTSLALRSADAGVQLERLIVGEHFTGVISEKGTPVGGVWGSDSLFGRICRDVEGGSIFGQELSKSAFLICDDDSRETADFYLVDPVKRLLAVIHAKAKDGAGGRGAGGLHDVIAQAQKHLGTIGPGGEGFNRKVMASRWAKDLKLNGHQVRRVHTGGTAAQASKAVEVALRDPNYSREVWVVASGILGKSVFLTKARSGDPNALQALYLLQSAWSATSSIGARLRVVVNA